MIQETQHIDHRPCRGLPFLLSKATWPFRVIRLGGIYFFVYIGALLTITLFLLFQVSAQADVLLTAFAKDSGFSEAIRINIITYCDVMLCLLTLPVFIVAFILPVRYVWRDGELDLLHMFEETGNDIVLFYETLLWVLAATFYLLVPPTAMLLVYVQFIQHIEEVAFRQSYVFIGATVILIGYARSLPFFLSPLIAVCLRVRAQEAIDISIAALRKKSFSFTVILIAVVAAISGSFYGIEKLTIEDLSKVYLRASVLFISFWYLISFISLLSLNTISEYFALQNGDRYINMFFPNEPVAKEPEQPEREATQEDLSSNPRLDYMSPEKPVKGRKRGRKARNSESGRKAS